ncbi:MAG TPA: hypothetical protein VGD80_39970 [Kofleriaceae bacterium]
MTAKIETTTREFKEGIAIRDGATISWESTGHLAVQLYDATGTVPLAGRTVEVVVPREGKLALETDGDGKVFHADVPFQDYELDLGSGVKVHAPAVSNPGDLQARHVPPIAYAFARLHVRRAHGLPVRGVALELRGPEDTQLSLRTDDDGFAEHKEPVPAGDYEIECAEGTATVALPDHPHGLAIVHLEPRGTEESA